MIHIAYATDAKCIKLVCMSIHDVLATKEPGTEITFHILLDQVEDVSLFKVFGQIQNIRVLLYHMDGNAIFNGKIPGPFPSYAAFFRLLIPMIKEISDVDRILYLDADTMVRRDLTYAYNTELSGYPFGWVKDHSYIDCYPEKPWPPDKYTHTDWFANSGVLLMDLNKLKERNYASIWIATCIHRYMDDQTVLNHVNHVDAAILPPTFNLFYQYFMMRRGHSLDLDYWNKYHHTSYSSLREIVDTSYIWHFADMKGFIFQHPLVRDLWCRWDERFDQFIKTGQPVPWSEEDKTKYIDSVLPN